MVKLFQLLELILSYHVYPRRFIGMLTTAAFCCVYLAWILVVAYVADLWVYPVLAVLSPVQRCKDLDLHSSL